MRTFEGEGIEVFSQERKYQIEEKGFSKEWQKEHPEFYNKGQLLYAARELCHKEPDFISLCAPLGWDYKWWIRLTKKSFKERLTISGSFLAAHYDFEF